LHKREAPRRLDFLPELAIVEGQSAVLGPRPLPFRGPKPDDPGSTIRAVAAKMVIPRWIQLVGLPLVLVGLWVVAGAVRHVVFLFLVAGLIALLLNPLVRALGRAWIPRGFAVAIVYLTFAAAVAMAGIALATVVVNETRSASDRIDIYFTQQRGQPPQTNAERDVDRLQVWLDSHGLQRVKIKRQAHDFLDNFGSKDVQRYTSKAIDWAEGAGIAVVQLLFSIVLVVVISIYMLLDMPKLARAVDRRFPPRPGSDALLPRIEHALASYVKGQLLLSAIIGTSAGLGLWLLGLLGWLPNGDKYALLFGLLVALTELIPYLGPWLGAIPPFVYALAVHPISAIWVAALFLFIHQIEGHIVVPNVMGSALRLHPLLVIFGLLAGGEVYGLPGVFVALPLLAAMREMWEFFTERVELAPWQPGEVDVEVDVEQPPKRPRAVGGS
jgi:predicted PurR-regulated permease PerM